MNGLGYYSSPIGEIRVESQGDAITGVAFTQEPREAEITTLAVAQCIEQLDEYFHRGRKFFTIEIKPEGTPFQLRIWSLLQTLPFGKTISYEQLASLAGDPKVIRAAGMASSQNPVAIIIPCHRVLGKNGELTGYAGGIEKKEWLLYHEGSLLRQLTLF